MQPSREPWRRPVEIPHLPPLPSVTVRRDARARSADDPVPLPRTEPSVGRGIEPAVA